MDIQNYKAASERTDADERALIPAISSQRPRETDEGYRRRIADTNKALGWTQITDIRDPACGHATHEHIYNGGNEPKGLLHFWRDPQNERWLAKAGEPASNKAQHSKQFGIKDGRPTLIPGDNRGTEEKLRCAQIQIESDKQTIANIQAHADKLAEASKVLAMLSLQSERYTNDTDYRNTTDKVLHNVRAYEAAQ